MSSVETPAPQISPLTPEALPLGEPLAWPVVDRDSTLLLERGAVLVGEPERSFLFAHFAPHRGDGEMPTEASQDTAGKTRAAAADLRDMALAPGALMGLRTHASGSSPMHPCRLIGFAPNDMLFVTPPYVDGRMIELMAGENVDVVVIASQTVYRFVCSAVASVQSPLEYLVLSKPAGIRRLRERQSIRVRTRLPVRYRLGNTEGPCDGVALAHGISVRGLSLTAPWVPGQVGERLHVAFTLHCDGLDTAIETSAIIRNVQAETGPGTYATLGLELDELTAADQMAMKAYVFDRQDDVQLWAGAVR